MKDFIEVTGTDGKTYLINKNHIISISSVGNNLPSITFSNGKEKVVKETYEDLKVELDN